MQRNGNVIKLLSDLVAIDSQSHKGNKEIIAYLAKLFSDYEQIQESWVRESDGVQGENLLVKIPGKDHEKSLVFVCHMDTVPTSSAWETDPFILEEKEGKLYGLGSCDTKGGVAAAIEAVLTLSDTPAYDTFFLFDGDEEAYTTGAKKYKKAMDLKNPSFVFVEPTDQAVCIAQRGVLSATVMTHGVAQHASLATVEKNEKENAIYKMSHVLEMLIQDAKEISSERDEVLGTHTQNLGLISGGTGGNVIPDMCRLAIDRRLLPQRDPIGEKKRLERLLQQYDSSIEITDVYTAPSFSTAIDSPIAHQSLSYMQEFYPKAKTEPFVAWSEAGLFSQKGDVVVLGPGSLIGQAHKANEFVEATELFHFVHVYQKIMQEISL